MEVRSANFVTSAAKPAQFLRRPIPHVVFTGKSNVGKSSILNKLLNRKSLAKTSGTPGKTRLINYFLINDRLFFVDVPGYGYAKVSKTERESWQGLIEDYLSNTPEIGLIFLLFDIRHDPGEHDRQMLSWLRARNMPYRILLTKADKLSNNKVASRHAAIAKTLDIDRSALIPSSAMTARGIREIWSHINQAYDDTSKILNKEGP